MNEKSRSTTYQDQCPFSITSTIFVSNIAPLSCVVPKCKTYMNVKEIYFWNKVFTYFFNKIPILISIENASSYVLRFVYFWNMKVFGVSWECSHSHTKIYMSEILLHYHVVLIDFKKCQICLLGLSFAS